MAKIERKYLAHYLNATPDAEATYERLGCDLEEYNVELNAEIEKKKNICGESSVILSSYEAQGSVEPFFADKDSKIYALLQKIIDGRLALDAAKSDAIEVHTWETDSAGAYPAYKESVIIEVVSYGGDTLGYQIPFNVHYLGDRVKGKFNPSTKTFQPDA